MTATTWVLKPVAWSDSEESVRGERYGLPVLGYGDAPRNMLATRRQLRAIGLRPGGQEPVAYLAFRHDTGHGHVSVYAELFLIATAVAKRTATPAQRAALAKANRARRTCPSCRQAAGYVIPREFGQCYRCWLLTADGRQFAAPQPIAA